MGESERGSGPDEAAENAAAESEQSYEHLEDWTPPPAQPLRVAIGLGATAAGRRALRLSVDQFLVVTVAGNSCAHTLARLPGNRGRALACSERVAHGDMRAFSNSQAKRISASADRR